MTIGWIKLHRLLLEKEIFQDAHTLQVFVYCLLKAAYKEMNVRVGNQVIELQPGQLLYGRKSVSQKLSIGEGKLRGIVDYLERSGSIEIEGHSKYSIVTIVNWEQYQKGEEPDFPFDCDFLDDEDGENKETDSSNQNKEENESNFDPFVYSYDGYKDWREESYGMEFPSRIRKSRESHNENEANTQPANNQLSAQSEIDFQDLDADNVTSREPQYNNIKNKINYNKTRVNNKKENKRKEDHQNIKNPCHYRQSDCAVNDHSMEERVAGQGISQCEYPSGGGITNGKCMSVSMTDTVDINSSSKALTALSSMDDAALDAYFASCSFADFDHTITELSDNYNNFINDDSFEPIPLDDSDLLSEHRRPGHDFITEMTYALTQQDIEQLDAMFQASIQ